MAEKRKKQLVKNIELEREEQIGLAYYEKYGAYLSYVDLSFLMGQENPTDFSRLIRLDAKRHKEDLLSLLRSDYASTLLEKFFIAKDANAEIESLPRYIDIPAHRHDFFEVACTLEGSCRHTVEGQSFLMRQGDVAVVPPNVQHHLLAAPDSRTFTVKIRRSAFESVFSSLMQGGTPLSSYISDVLYARHYHNCLTFHCGGDPFLPDLIRHMTEQQTQKKSCWHQVLEGLLTTFFAYIVQNYGEAVEFFAGDNAQSDRISAVEAYLRRNFSTATLTGTAEHFFLSPSYLSALIKSQTGHTFSSILQRIRMDRAVELLTGTDRKVSWICEQVGYQDTTQFIRTFKKHYGITPHQFRKLKKEEQAALLYC